MISRKYPLDLLFADPCDSVKMMLTFYSKVVSHGFDLFCLSWAPQVRQNSGQIHRCPLDGAGVFGCPEAFTVLGWLGQLQRIDGFDKAQGFGLGVLEVCDVHFL